MKCAIFEEHSSSCVVYFRFSGALFPVSMLDGDIDNFILMMWLYIGFGLVFMFTTDQELVTFIVIRTLIFLYYYTISQNPTLAFGISPSESFIRNKNSAGDIPIILAVEIQFLELVFQIWCLADLLASYVANKC